MQAYLPHARNLDSRLVLWVSPVDTQGAAVDPVFLDAAHSIGIKSFLYRARNLNDASRTLELVEQAVHKASHAHKLRSVEKPAAYLLRTFANLVKAELDTAGRFLALSDGVAQLSAHQRTSEVQQKLDRLVERREVLDSVDATMRNVLWRLFWGFTITEIANALGIAPSTLSKRLSRTRKRLKKALDPDCPRGRPSRVNETSRARTHAGGDLPANGA